MISRVRPPNVDFIRILVSCHFSNLLQLSPALINAQVKVLCEFLVAQICKFEESDRRNLPLPEHIFSPSMVGLISEYQYKIHLEDLTLSLV